jgi:hypothetical protein
MRMNLQSTTGKKLDTCTWAWGCIQSPETWAGSLTRTDGPVNNLILPVRIAEVTLSSMFVTDYLCPMFQLKSVGDLVVSVFAGMHGRSKSFYQLILNLSYSHLCYVCDGLRDIYVAHSRAGGQI